MILFYTVISHILIINVTKYVISLNDQNLNVIILQNHYLEAYVVTMLTFALFSKMPFSLPEVGEGRSLGTLMTSYRR